MITWKDKSVPHNRQLFVTGEGTTSSAIAERPRDARVTSIRKIAKWNF